MQTAVGRIFENSKRKRNSVFVLAVGTVSIDILFVRMNLYGEIRFALALIAFATIVYLDDGDLPSLGLRMNPKQGWRTWLDLSIKIALIFGLLIGVGFVLWSKTHKSGLGNLIIKTAPTNINSRFIDMCVITPILEETTYRLVFCVSLVSLLGSSKTIIVNGIIFGILHIFYGNPSPENLIGGFFLAWVFLKSESILLPLIFHSLGNIIALAVQVAAWYFLR